MTTNKIPRKVTEEESNYLHSLTSLDMTRELLRDLFAKYEGKRKFEPNDKIDVKMDKFDPNNKEIIKSTVGRFIFNIYMNNYYNPFFYRINGYVNTILDSKKIDELNDTMSKALIEKRITSDDYITYINLRDKIAYYIVGFISNSMTINSLIPLKSVEKRKEELFKKYEKEINNNNVSVVSEIEKELLDIAKKELKDEPGMDTYNSGARGSFNTNYKQTSIMRGVMFSSDGKKSIRISKGNLLSGIPKEDTPYYNDLSIQSFYAKGVETAKGGYLSKQLAASFQGLVLDEKDTDCKTPKTLNITITEKNKDQFFLRYIEDKGDLILLTDEKLNELIGKTVKLRTPLYCNSDKICNKCAGELYYNLDVKNVGLMFNVIGTSLLNLSMKSFHDTAVKVGSIDPNKLIEEI